MQEKQRHREWQRQLEIWPKSAYTSLPPPTDFSCCTWIQVDSLAAVLGWLDFAADNDSSPTPTHCLSPSTWESIIAQPGLVWPGHTCDKLPSPAPCPLLLLLLIFCHISRCQVLPHVASFQAGFGPGLGSALFTCQQFEIDKFLPRPNYI